MIKILNLNYSYTKFFFSIFSKIRRYIENIIIFYTFLNKILTKTMLINNKKLS